MSSQQPHRIRRNESPSSTKQGPIKAVKAFSLKKSNAPSAFETSPKDSHKLWTRYSPDNRFSPERTSSKTSHSRSPNICHKDKTTGSRESPLPGKLRPSSADAVVPSYLTGQWPKDINSLSQSQSDGVYMCDKSAQTVELEIKNIRKEKSHRRSASLGQGDQPQLQYIKQCLQKSKDGNKFPEGRQHTSPVPGHHLALSLMPPPVACLQHKAALHSARRMTRHSVNKFQRNSVEGLNMEIEKLVSSITSSSLTAADDDGEVFRYEIPDGHRAPGPEFIHGSSIQSVDTQTTSHLDNPVTASPANRSASISPVITPRPGSLDIYLTPRPKSSDSKFSKGDVDSPEYTAFISSPNFKKSCPFVREPPDGCEKVTAVEESRRPKIKEPLHFSPVKPNQFVFKPSQGSAFCPLTKTFPLICTDSSSQVFSGSFDE